MSSRLIKDLEARALEARTDDERLQIRAERAGALARLGRLADARSEIAELRSLNTHYSPPLTAWILFAEGLVEHFSALGPAARDRYSRAYAIAASVGDRRLRGLAAAWLASWEFRAGDIHVALDKAVESVCDGELDDHATLSRSYLVLAGCLGIAGEPTESDRYFALARSHAISGADISMQSVILHNSATAKLNRLTIENAFELRPSEDPGRIELELQSMASLEAGIGLTTLKAGTGLVLAQLHVCKGAWSDALSLFASNFEDSLSQGFERWRARSLADMALCLSKLGDEAGASRLAKESIQSIAAAGDADDLAITHARLASTFQAIGDCEAASHHRSAALIHLETFRHSQRELLAKIGEARSRLDANSSAKGAD